jgi:putative ABC transport system permease protein
MRFIELLRLVKNNLLRMKFRVLMTSAGVFIGVTAVILLVSMGVGLQQFVLEGFTGISDLTELQVSSPGGTFFAGPGVTVANNQSSDVILSERAIEQFRQLPGVVAATPILRTGGQIRLNRLMSFSTIQGIDANEVSRFDFAVESGTATLGPWQALVGARVADNFSNPQTGEQAADLDLQGQTLHLTLTRTNADGEQTERTVRFRVVGVLSESGGERDFSIYVPLNNAEDLNTWATGQRTNPNRDGYDQALVKVSSPDQAQAVEQAITQQGFFVFSFQQVLASINTTFLVIQIIVGGIGALALVVAAFGIANTMIMAIYERTREIGLMKAVGATNRDVMLIFLVEAGAIGVIGGLGGVLAGMGLGQLFGFVGGEFLRAQIAQGGGGGADTLGTLVHTPLWLPLFAIIFAAFVGVVAGIYPALRAIRLDPIAALRYE